MQKIFDDDHIKVIYTKEDLENFRNEVNNGNSFSDMYIYLANDMILEEGSEWNPIGKYFADNNATSKPFNGIFDGNNHKIENLHINNENEKYNGLFGYNTGKIKNIQISTTSNIVGNGNEGAIVGYNKGEISSCISQAKIQSTGNNVGGVVGKNEGNVIGCKNIGTIINSAQTTGGVVGWNCKNGIIENCYNEGNISTLYQMAGGIAGSNDGTVRKSWNKANIQTTSYTIGGIVGSNNGTIEETYNQRKCDFFRLFFQFSRNNEFGNRRDSRRQLC